MTIKFNKYENLHDKLLPLCSVFLGNANVKIIDDDEEKINYQIDHDVYIENSIDGIYTADSIDDNLIYEILNCLDGELDFDKAKSIIQSWIRPFGDVNFLILSIPTGTQNPYGQELPAVVKNVLQEHFTQALAKNR